jgi:hypothetical protein
MQKQTDERIVLNVGGVRYETYKSTLLKYPNTLLATMFSDRNRELLVKDDNGEYFIDRNGKAFEAILDWYRTGQLLVPPSCTPEMIQRELDYFQIPIEVQHDEYEYISFNWEQAYGPGQCDYQYLYLISVEGKKELASIKGKWNTEGITPLKLCALITCINKFGINIQSPVF